MLGEGFTLNVAPTNCFRNLDMKPGYVKDRIPNPSELGLVTQVCNDAVVTNTCIIWICSCTLHRRHSRWCAELLVILLTLLFYLHHAGGMQYPVDSRNNGALLGLIETCIRLYMSQSNSLLLLLTEDYLEPCRSMLCPV